MSVVVVSSVVWCLFFVFVFKQKTAYEVRISDWSSDVCSSDLVPLDDPIEKWTDAAFWDELRRRIPEDAAARIVTGASIEKSIAPLRSFVAEPMRWGDRKGVV